MGRVPVPAALVVIAEAAQVRPFSVSLTAEEVKEDIYALTGARPRRRPRKRPRAVQRQLDVRRTPRTALAPTPLLPNHFIN